MKTYYIIIILLAITKGIASTEDTLTASIRSLGTLSSSGHPAFWLHANTRGVVDQSTNNILILPELYAEKRLANFISVKSGISAMAALPENIILPEAYGAIDFWDISIWTGRRRYQLGSMNEQLSSGSVFLGRNALPDWGAGIGVFEWSNLPLTKGYIQVKGGLSHKWPENMSNATNPLLHEKWAYIRSNKLPVNIEIGMNHMAYFGGIQSSTGNAIPDDYFRVFFAQPTKAPGEFEGEFVNVLGGHFGLLDLGLNTKIGEWYVRAHWQKVINDRVSYVQRFRRNRDNILGLTVNTPIKWMQEIHLEYMNTTFQNGLGIPDPIAPDGRFMAVPSWENDIEATMLRYFDPQYVLDTYGFVIDADMPLGEALFVMQEEWNEGNEYGGRSDYFNKYLYSQAFTNFGRNIGNPLFTSRALWEVYNEDPLRFDRNIINNRIRSFHLGLSGELDPLPIAYTILSTYSRNFGSYRGKYQGRFNWPTEAELEGYDYFFKQPVNQLNMLIRLDYQYTESWIFESSLGFDIGGLTNNIGIQFGATYQLF